jgi:Ribonuclease G/E
LSSARRNEDDGYRIVEAVVSRNGIARPCSAAYLLEEEATGMARTYRDTAIEEMLGTVEEAMSQVVDWRGDLPPSMKEAIEQFRSKLGAAIDSVEFVKRALDRQVQETDRGKGPA